MGLLYFFSIQPVKPNLKIMKKSLSTLIIAFVFLFANAQDYEITFAGAGASSTVDSVLVENLTQGTSIKLSGTDTLLLTKVTTGINSFSRGSNLPLRVYPNPFSSECKIEFSTQKSENITIRIFDLSGRLTTSKVKHVEQGNHHFQISGIPQGMYIVQVRSAKLFQTAKILSYNHSTNYPEIKYQGFSTTVKTQLIKKSASGIRKMVPYYNDDNILLMASNYDDNFFVSRGITMNEDVEIENSAPFIFEFIPCIDPDGRKYSIVKIVDQTWMSENYAYEAGNGSWVYGNDENNVATYGRLYTWEAAMGNAPEGWHLPTDDEWTQLQEFLAEKYDDNLSSTLKNDTGWLPGENENSGNGTNASGFAAVPGGARWFINGSFYAKDERAYFWTSTKHDSIRATMRKFTSSDTQIGQGYSNVDYGFSVRYIKDESVDEGEVQISGMLDESLLALINVEELQIRSVNDSSQLTAQGSFEINSYRYDNNEQPPIIFTKGEDIIFGCYPTTTSNNTITFDDILFFYLDLSSDIRRMEFPKSKIMELATVSSYYNSTLNAFTSSLQNDIVPCDNSEFVSSFKNLIIDITTQNQQNNMATKSVQAGTYKFNFERDGTIKWDGEIPVFASLGLDIKKVDDNKTVFGPIILQGDSYMFSPTSLLAYGLTYLFDEKSLDKSSSFKLTDEGEYKISLCNDEDYIANHNKNVFLVDLIQLFFPTNYFKYFKSDCVNSIAATLLPIFSNVREKFIYDESFSTLDFTNLLKDLPLSLIGILYDCSHINLFNLAKLSFNLAKKLDVINYVESSLNLSLLIRDGYLSDINDSQPRYFYDGVSFNELKFYDFPYDTLKGNPQDTFLYISKIDEKDYTFDFQRGDLETNLVVSETYEFASDLPFKFSRTSGDAQYGAETINALSGNIKTTFKLGKEDSQIILEPDFKESKIIPDTINIVVNIIIPEFDVFGPYCEGDEIPTLPLISNNEITGTWSPEINNSSTTEYLFTPNEGQDAENASLTITITPKSIPVFDVQKSYSKGSEIPALPTESVNNISGTWQPAINNQSTTTYTFTPNNGECASIITLTITIQESEDSTFTDSRDGNVYKMVGIGNQIWMAENLAYLPSLNSTEVSYDEPKYYVYGYNGTDVNAAKALPIYSSYGVLYNWAAANISCPSGWHLPCDDEWEQLALSVNSVYGPYNKVQKDWEGIGKHLKADNTWNSSLYNPNEGTDDLGFSALPGGIRLTGTNTSSFREISRSGYWWSSTEDSDYRSWRRELESASTDFLNANYNKKGGFSVRCLKD